MTIQAISITELQNKVSGALNTPDFKNVWLKCEISELTAKHHAYLSLTQTENSKVVAKISAKIWKTQVSIIFDKFFKGSGVQLRQGLEVLVKGTVENHPSYGLSITLTDIDPSFTVGKMQLKMQMIRDALIQKNCYKSNHRYELPSFFRNVAVVTPDGSAGRDDFKVDADRLEKHGLCTFTYYHATMQGLVAEESISQQIAQANKDHKRKPYDALIIIRGGGAAIDLSWLSNYKSAYYICNSLMPVITGLGHERDISILCEVASKNAGTPSKCIELISKTNLSQVQRIKDTLLEIKANFHNTLKNSKTSIIQRKNEIEFGFKNGIRNGYSFIKNKYTEVGFLHQNNINLNSKFLNLQSHTLSNQYSEILTTSSVNNSTLMFERSRLYKIKLNDSSKTLSEFKNYLTDCFTTNLKQNHIKITESQKWIVEGFRMSIANQNKNLCYSREQIKLSTMTVTKNMSLNAIFSAQRLQENHNNCIKTNKKLVNYATHEIQNSFLKQLTNNHNSVNELCSKLNKSFSFSLESSSRTFSHMKESIILFNPNKMLSKGYALILDENKNIVTNAETANLNNVLHIEFNDKSITVNTTGETNERITGI